MEDALIEAGRSPERTSLLPGEGFFVPDSIAKQRDREELEATIAGADTVVVADPDADGLACVALLREARPPAALVPTGPHELAAGLERVAEFGEPGMTVFVFDLAPDTFEEIEGPLTAIVERAADVRWFDHHRWDEDTADAVRAAGISLVLGDSEAVCTADVVVEAVDYDFPDHLVELAAVTRDHDLWIREDPRSDDLADYAHWVDAGTYVETVGTHGPDLPADALDLLAERRVQKEEFIDRALRRAEYHRLGDTTIGLTYGRCSQNEVAEGMREAGADAAVIVKPAGSASIRGTETFDRCHEVARLVGGGGHPKAAGCKPDIYDDMLDYGYHWTTQGATAKRVILRAFETVVDE